MYIIPYVIDTPFPSVEPGEILYFQKDRFDSEGNIETYTEAWKIVSTREVVKGKMFEITIQSESGRIDIAFVSRFKAKK